MVNNAAAHGEHPPLSTDYAAWRRAWERIIAVNLHGPANLSLLAAQAMARAGGGRIVNISSRGAFRGEPEAPGYGASKAGLNSLSQSLAKALAPDGVLVYCIAPGWVETEMAAEFLAGPRGGEIRAQHPLGRVTRRRRGRPRRGLLRPGRARGHDGRHGRRQRRLLPAHVTAGGRPQRSRKKQDDGEAGSSRCRAATRPAAGSISCLVASDSARFLSTK